MGSGPPVMGAAAGGVTSSLATAPANCCVVPSVIRNYPALMLLAAACSSAHCLRAPVEVSTPTGACGPPGGSCSPAAVPLGPISVRCLRQPRRLWRASREGAQPGHKHPPGRPRAPPAQPCGCALRCVRCRWHKRWSWRLCRAEPQQRGQRPRGAGTRRCWGAWLCWPAPRWGLGGVCLGQAAPRPPLRLFNCLMLQLWLEGPGSCSLKSGQAE